METAARIREHLRLPGMGDTTARHFRDKLIVNYVACFHIQKNSRRHSLSKEFDGTSGSVQVPPSLVLNPTTGLSLETWVKATTTGGWQRMLGKGSNGSDWDLWIAPGGAAYLQLGRVAGAASASGVAVGGVVGASVAVAAAVAVGPPGVAVVAAVP